MPASFLASLLLLAAAPDIAPLPDAVPVSPAAQSTAIAPTTTISLLPDRATQLSAVVLVLDPDDRLAAVQEHPTISLLSGDRTQQAPLGEENRFAAVAGVGARQVSFDAQDFGVSARLQAVDRSRLQLRLGEERPLRFDLVGSPQRTEAALSWQVLPALTLAGRSRGDGGATFSGKVTFGDRHRHSLALIRQEPATNISTTEARLALGGAVPTQIHYHVRERGSDRLQIRQDLGGLRWEIRHQTESLRISTALALSRNPKGRRLASLNLEHLVQNRDRNARALTTATLNSRLWGWQGTLGVAWNERGQTGAIVSARIPVFGQTFGINGSYRGIALNGRRRDYRLELRSRLRF